MTALLVALGAGLGAVLRFVTATHLDTPRFPTGTWLVNVVGSFVLGLLHGAGVGGEALALLGVGLCGGFTTYSSFAVQTRTLGHEQAWWRGAAYAVVTLVVSLAAAALGHVVGQA